MKEFCSIVHKILEVILLSGSLEFCLAFQRRIMVLCCSVSML